MNRAILAQLQRSRPLIRQRWEELLRAAPVSSPLANPDAMAMHIPGSIGEIVHQLGSAVRRGGVRRRRRAVPIETDCGHNPYRAYFQAGEQAIAEAVVLARTACHVHEPDSDWAAEVAVVVRALAGAKIDAFCRVCRNYRLVDGCRFAGTRGATALSS